MISHERKATDPDPQQIAEQFLDSFEQHGSYDRPLIEQLAALATGQDKASRVSASKVIFTSLVERLSDSFDPVAVTLYNRLFAQLVQQCRLLDPNLDRTLSLFGLQCEADLFQRAQRLRQVECRTDKHRRVDRVILLSRVTLGADVAITSVIIEGLKTVFPAADVIVVGSEKVRDLFGGDPQLRFCSLEYKRASQFTDRLLCWIDLLEELEQLTKDEESSLIVDPDSRLTQLGILPVLRTCSNYLYFPSREFGSGGSESLGELSSRWLSDVYRLKDRVFPYVSLSRSDRRAAREIRAKFYRTGSKPMITVNLGVGDNSAKRVGEEFERGLLGGLLDSGSIVVLDRGIGADESGLIDRLIGYLGQAATSRMRVVEMDQHSLSEATAAEPMDCDLIVWRGGIGPFAAFIGESDLYIGYDSACQHIAAALNTPCIDIFAGHSSRRMIERWRPTGRSLVEVIDARATQGERLVSLVLQRAFGILRQTAPAAGAE